MQFNLGLNNEVPLICPLCKHGRTHQKSCKNIWCFKSKGGEGLKTFTANNTSRTTYVEEEKGDIIKINFTFEQCGNLPQYNLCIKRTVCKEFSACSVNHLAQSGFPSSPSLVQLFD